MAIYDTSGIESMAPSSVSERDEAARAAVFQKARMLACGGGAAASSSSSGGRRSSHRHHDFTSLPLVYIHWKKVGIWLGMLLMSK